MTAVAAPSRSDETVRLFTLRNAAGSAEERAEIEDQLIRLNMAVAVDATRRFRGRGIATEDLEQVAYVGLVKAVKGFDPDRGHDFLSFAIPTIRGEVRRHFRDLGWAVRPPRSIQEAQTKIIACEGELYQQLGRAPRPSEIAEHLDIDRELVVEALGASGCFAPASLDAPSHEGEEDPISRRLGYSDEGFDLAEARAVLAPVLAKLSRREQLIVEMRFFRGCTQAQIGEAIGVTQMQVSRLLTRLMARMREELQVELVA
jgi:RNA polymerase sigma-B factor